MKTIGFLISDKENENRIAILPKDIEKIEYKNLLYFEKGYAHSMNIEDSEYLKLGCNVVDRKEVLKQDIICDLKIGDSSYINKLSDNKVLFGWFHAVKNKELTDILIKKKMTAIAWEDMYDAEKHVFSYNNELAGYAAIIDAYLYYGILPKDTKVAILGNGNTSRGAQKALSSLETSFDVFKRDEEKDFIQRIHDYDVIVNCVLWDIKRKDHIINKNDLKRMKKNSMIIDISCDESGAIESSKATTLEHPIYYEDGILHYAVDHTPSIFYKSFSENCSSFIWKYINKLIKEENDLILRNATIIKNGKILDKKIIDFQER